jgi:cell division protein FtsA
VARQLVNEVIRTRLEETLQLVRRRLPEGALQRIGSGVFLTGGGSLMHGFGELVHEAFGTAIYRPEGADISGVHATFKDPRYSTAVGLIRYAQLMDPALRGEHRGVIGKLARILWPFGS